MYQELPATHEPEPAAISEDASWWQLTTSFLFIQNGLRHAKLLFFLSTRNHQFRMTASPRGTERLKSRQASKPVAKADK